MPIMDRYESTHFFVRSCRQGQGQWSASFESKLGTHYGEWTWGEKPKFWDDLVQAVDSHTRVRLSLVIEVDPKDGGGRTIGTPRALRLLDGESDQR